MPMNGEHLDTDGTDLGGINLQSEGGTENSIPEEGPLPPPWPSRWATPIA